MKINKDVVRAALICNEWKHIYTNGMEQDEMFGEEGNLVL